MFTIPDKGEGLDNVQSVWFQEYIDVLVAGIAGTEAVVSGCEVTPSAGMTLAVAAGTVNSVGLPYTVAASSPVITVADPTYTRLDLVVVNSAGAVVVRTAPAAATIKPAARLVGDVVLAVVYVPVGTVAIASNNLVDLRVSILNSSLIGHQPTTGAATTVQLELRSHEAKLDYVVNAKDAAFGAVGDGVTNDTAAIQAAIDYVANIAAPYKGGIVDLPSGIFSAAGLVLKNRVFLRGQGRGATIIRAPDGVNTDILTIPDSAALIGWSGITFDGNAANQTSGSGIVFATVASSEGNSFAPFTAKVDTSPESYKHCIAYDFVVGNCKDNGVSTTPANYQIFFDNFTVSHNGQDGLYVSSSDGIYSNFYCEKNGRAGLWASGAVNKFSNGKVIWNGRTDNTYGGLREQGTSNTFSLVEAQDNYTDGILILGASPIFMGCSANTNGYLAVGSETQSSGVHADIRIGASATNISFDGEVHTYKTAVGTDGLWTTQWPYYFNSYAAGQIVKWQVAFDHAKYNAAPNLAILQLTRGKLGDIGMFSSDGINTVLDIDPKSLTGEGNKTTRNWRNSEVTGTCTESWYTPGTSNEQHRLTGNGDTLLNQFGGNVIIGSAVTGGAWDTGHARLGIYHLWVDSLGKLRIKSAVPTSDTDGAVVGTQA